MFPVADITVETAARTFVMVGSHVLVSHPLCSTDHGQQFESTLWRQFMELLGTKQIRTTSYHPIANGLVERFHRQLKAALKSHPNPTNWVDSLPVVLLGICTALK